MKIPLFSFFTSMFPERMEVLEYTGKFEVELRAFPGSTSRKLFFSLTCFRLYVRKRLSLGILRLTLSWPIWTKFPVYVAMSLDPRTSPNEHSRTNISAKLGEGVNFLNSFNPFILKTIKDIESQKVSSWCNMGRPTKLILNVFSIFLSVFEMFWKIMGSNQFVRGQGFQKSLDVCRKTWLHLFFQLEIESPLDSLQLVGLIFPQEEGRGCFFVIFRRPAGMSQLRKVRKKSVKIWPGKVKENCFKVGKKFRFWQIFLLP